MPALKACDEKCQTDCWNAYESCDKRATDDAAKEACAQTWQNCGSKAAVAVTKEIHPGKKLSSSSDRSSIFCYDTARLVMDA